MGATRGGRDGAGLAALVAAACLWACGGPEPPSPDPGDSGRLAPPSRLTPGQAPGAAVMEPPELRAGDPGTFAVHVTLGDGGIAPGGGLLLEFPKAWMAELYPWPRPYQTEAPGRGQYVSARASRPGAELEVALETRGLAGKIDRFPRVVAVALRAGELREGDRVSVALERGAGPYLAGPGEVRVAIDAAGSGEHRLLARSAGYRVLPGPPVHYDLFAPSQGAVGTPLEASLVAFDRFDNPVPMPGARVSLLVEREGPEPVATSPLEDGRAVFRWTPSATGFHWPRATVVVPPANGRGIVRHTVSGDPIRVGEGPVRTGVYWGDLHSHSQISQDAIGSGDYEYARDVTALSFFGSTEHTEDGAEWPGKVDGMLPSEWAEVQRRVREFYEPGRFVTLLGYEVAQHRGHHCVYYPTDNGPYIGAHEAPGIRALWARLAPGPALTVPHHLGRQTRVDDAPADLLLAPPVEPRQTPRSGPTPNWPREPSNPMRRVLEIYSKHGSSEMLAPDDPLAYESVRFLASNSARGPHYARDAWAAGARLGTIAASDNHTAQPGLPHTGLTAVRLESLTREALFEALYRSRTYATTGARFYLDFEVGSVGMGRSGRVGGAITGKVLVAARGTLSTVEVMRYDSTGWNVAARWENVDRLLEADFKDPAATRPAIYYLRAELAEPVRDRVARAWSSPVWIDPPQERRRRRGRGNRGPKATGTP